MKKFLMTFSFVILNILLSSNIFWIIGYFVILFLLISPSQPVSNILLLCFFIFLQILAVGKLFLFPFLYTFIAKKREFDKFFVKNNIIIMLSLALLSDFVFIYIWYKFELYILFLYILSFGGVFICYLSLIVWFKISKKLTKSTEAK